MKNVSIYGKKWLAIIFEQKNKEYGAFELRQNEEKTTLKAFFSGVGALVLILATMVFFTSFGDKPEELTIVLIKPVSPTLFKIKTKQVVAKKNLSPKKAISTKKTPNSGQIQIVKTEKADPTTTVINVEPKSFTDNSDGGTTNATVGGTFSGSPVTPETINPNGVESSANVDAQPTFPGGMERFYTYVGRTFNKPEYEEPKTIRLLVQFVVERDGALSNIIVLSKTDIDLNNEAIRVLKSLKTKWNAGIKDGQKVRTQYTLPITILSE